MIPKWYNDPYASLTPQEQEERAEYLEYRDNVTAWHTGDLTSMHRDLTLAQLEKRKEDEAKQKESNLSN